MISKEFFVKIINRLRETDDIKNKIDELIRSSTEVKMSDYTQDTSLMICHEDIVVDLLQSIFEDNEDVLGYWLYECDYGRSYKKRRYNR